MKEGDLFGMGNPLLDIQATVDKEFVEKYKLKLNDAILCDDEHVPLFHDMIEKYDVEYIAGGATQNAMRVCQWVIGGKSRPNIATFTGCIGSDAFGNQLEESARSVGVNTIYMRHPTVKTGTCATLITDHGKNRSLCAHLAAANCFDADHLKKPEIWQFVERAQVFYIAGFFLTVCPAGIQMVAEFACKQNRLFLMNLSAPFLSGAFKEPMLAALPYVDVLFGNDSEALEFAKNQGWTTTDLNEIALKISDWPKENKQRARLVVITCGEQPVIAAEAGKAITTHPIIALPSEKLVDTNGAGDSFVGGYLAQLLQGKSVDECIRCGIWTATEIIQRHGCTFPETCTFK